jgi:ribosome-associated translation inhibitor RaiA
MKTPNKKQKPSQNENSEIMDRLNLENLDPDVKAYIYQTVNEFENYVTPQTLIAVIARDPLKLITNTDTVGELDLTKDDLKKMYRIAICLNEEGSKLEAEAVDQNIYQAINKAKAKLLKHLSEIQDDVISNQDRRNQIKAATSSSSSH